MFVFYLRRYSLAAYSQLLFHVHVQSLSTQIVVQLKSSGHVIPIAVVLQVGLLFCRSVHMQQ